MGGMTGTFTLEAGEDDGSAWKRGIYLGCCNSAFIDFGSYDLIKILDHEGKPVQPHYDEFIEYIDDVPLMVWAGWEDEASKESAAQSMMTAREEEEEDEEEEEGQKEGKEEGQSGACTNSFST